MEMEMGLTGTLTRDIRILVEMTLTGNTKESPAI